VLHHLIDHRDPYRARQRISGEGVSVRELQVGFRGSEERIRRRTTRALKTVGARDLRFEAQ